MEIWDRPDGSFITLEQAKAANDTVLKNFAAQLPDNYVIADLRHSPDRAGFAWGKFGPHIENAIRHNDELLWAFEK